MSRLKRLLIPILLFASAAFVPARPSWAAGTLYTIASSGPQSQRINVVVLSEGYTSAQQAQFLTDAAQFYTKLVSVPPWDRYATYLNGYAVFIASNQSGADDPSAGIYRDTYFNSTFDSYGTGRLLTIPPNDRDANYANGYGKVYNLLATHVPSYDIVVLLVNDAQYGGSGGAVAIASVHASSAEIAVHEIGHTHAKLGDEYANPYPGYPDVEEPNTTQQTVRSLIKWNAWIPPSVPIPTEAKAEYSNVTGLFEGAHYHTTGWYRPNMDCKMRTLGSAYCPVCAQTHVLANYALVSPIDSMVPLSPTVSIAALLPQTLRVVTKRPDGVLPRIRWYDNGVLLSNTTTSVLFTTLNLVLGTHQIKCVVTDTTSLVRVDPSGLLKDSAMWTVTVTGACSCPCSGDPYCDGLVTVLDIVATADVAFGRTPPATSGGCIYSDTDVDCSGVTNAVDVVKVVNVAFRNANRATEFCDPCP